MSGKQEVVAAGGAGLLALSFWTGPNRKTISGAFFSDSASDHDLKAAHSALVKYAGAALAIGAGVLLAGASEQFGSAMVAILAALYILWAINHFAGK